MIEAVEIHSFKVFIIIFDFRLILSNRVWVDYTCDVNFFFLNLLAWHKFKTFRRMLPTLS